jgi:uncharacterized protein (DUF983 family)
MAGALAVCQEGASMSEGKIICPDCDKGKFCLELHGSRIIVTCSKCGLQLRQLDAAEFSEYPRWIADSMRS